jgi:UDP-2,3-diacylglucosamine pyrophosphatase LpxH
MRPTEELIRTAIQEMGGFRPAARYLRENGYDISESGIRSMNKRWQSDEFELEMEYPEGEPEAPIDIEALISRRIEQFARKRTNYEREKLIHVRVNRDGPIGLGFFGDMHLDDDGTDLESVLRDVDLFDGRHEGLFAGNVGDVFNNWAGRLARLYSEQSTSSAESLALVEHVLTRIQWLYYHDGNHDLWGQGGDLLKLILRNHAVVHKSNRIRLALRLPNGRNVKVYSVHGFQGKSMWSEVYGAAKKAQLDGEHHDIYVGGHIHTSGYTHGRRPNSDRIWHALQVASYKKIDRYAEELNLDAKDLYACPVALIDPNAKTEINFIRFEFDPHEAALRLKWMRDRWASGKSAS